AAGRRMRDGRYPFRDRVLLDRPPAPGLAPAAPDPDGMVGAAEHVALARDTPEDVRIAVESRAPGVLVVVQSWDPGWSARVDGRDAPLSVADGAFQGVAVPAGAHEVRLRYAPRGLVAGALLSAAALALLAGVLWRG